VVPTLEQARLTPLVQQSDAFACERLPDPADRGVGRFDHPLDLRPRRRGGGEQQLVVFAGARGELESVAADRSCDLVDALVERGVVRGDARSPKGSTWVLEVSDGLVTKASFLPAPK
jgi:hypothetical protein